MIGAEDEGRIRVEGGLMSRLDAAVEPTQKDTGLGWTHGLSRLKKTRIRQDAHGLSRLNTCYIIKRKICFLSP